MAIPTAHCAHGARVPRSSYRPAASRSPIMFDLGPKLVDLGPTSAELGPDPADASPNLADSSRIRLELARSLSQSGPFQAKSKLAEIGPASVGGRFRDKLDRFRGILCRIVRRRPKFGRSRFWRKLAVFGRNCLKSGQRWPESGRMRYVSAQFWPNFGPMRLR